MRRLPFIVLACLLSSAAQAAPHVVVSIKPLYSLVASVMDGVGTPALLVKGSASPHTYALKPSDAKALSDADLIVWVGPGMEPFLVKPLATLGAKATTVQAITLPGMLLLPNRDGGVWDVDPDELEAKPGAPKVDEGPNNVHVWLDAGNAAVIVDAIAAALDTKDPADKVTFDANAAKVKQRLQALDGEMVAKLGPIRGKPFIVFHDAYQYLEQRYGLKAVGSVTVVPDVMPGPKRLKALRTKIQSLGATCVFAEPYTQPRILEAVMAGTQAKSAVLDPEGTGKTESTDLYFDLMQQNTKALADCLTQ